MKKLYFYLTTVGFSALSFAQNQMDVVNCWNQVSESSIPMVGKRVIKPTTYLTYQLNVNRMRSVLANVKHMDASDYQAVYISLPKSDGTFGTYQVYQNETMSPGLAEKFPEIRTYDAVSTNQSGEVVKLDLTPQGFHAMTLIPGQFTEFIDPYSFGGGDILNYQVYSKADFKSDKTFECHKDGAEIDGHSTQDTPKSFGNCTKRTYRLALSATAEYTTFHGGSVAGAQAAQVTTMNRVNGVYMRDLAVTLTIIGNNNLLIYTNAGSDPYTNGDPGQMIDENQTNTDNVIGSSNYDIGHVFGTNSGGLAGLGVVCYAGYKAQGVTGSASPVGDPFDIDYVAHEMGHEFGGDHSFRGNAGSCSGNANSATAMEPGSGSTIMAYAGICSPQNVQNNSNDYFHGVNMLQIHTFINGGGNSCAVSSPIANQTAPNITSTIGNITIPKGTPFALTATATDADGDVLTYCWEQMNNQNSTQPPLATATGGPNFRSFSPTASGTRYFPSLAKLMSSGPFTWEMLPTVARTMNFRCVVRDNEANGGCNDHEDITVTVSAAAGPFVVTYPSVTGITWYGLSSKTVTWDVANTNQSPVSCTNVDILLSTDNGVTYSNIANDVPNTGTYAITVPNINTTQAYIMVMSQNGSFFDISDKKFTITSSGAGISENSILNEAVVYPNPSKGAFTISFGKELLVQSIAVMDVSGRLIQEASVKQLLENYQVDLSTESKGIYFLHVTVDGQTKAFKLVKE